MINSIYQDTAVSIAFYDGKVFKSIGELSEYLMINHKFTKSGVDAIISKLPRIRREEMLAFLEEVKDSTPNRCAKITQMTAPVEEVKIKSTKRKSSKKKHR